MNNSSQLIFKERASRMGIMRDSTCSLLAHFHRYIFSVIFMSK
ncbi:hypothetical protein [Colwellia sp. TT2012]|nr:hypothetical protein [Colwellia sp. TT2012]